MNADFAVLNPGGRDPVRLFPQGAGEPGDPGHAPINYHAYAACRNGGFFRKAGEIPEEVRAVLVLLRRKGLDEARRAVEGLKAGGRTVFISWKESGLHQVAEALADAGRYQAFRAVCREADGFIASTPELVPLYTASGCREGGFIPTPYPVENPAWDFSRHVEERAGIFIGTREFAVPSRNHLLAVSTACTLGAVTVINTEGRSGEKLLRAISPDIRIMPGPLPYPDYLRLMASHRIVFQLDRSAVPGQVAGDALLAGVPCVGGDGAVDRLVFPDLAGPLSPAAEMAERLLTDDDAYRRALLRSREHARETVGFVPVAARLGALIA